MFEDPIEVVFSRAQRLQYARRRVAKLAKQKEQMFNRKIRTNKIPFAQRSAEDRIFLVTFNKEFYVIDKVQGMWTAYIVMQANVSPGEVDWPKEHQKAAYYRRTFQDPLLNGQRAASN